MAADFQTQQNHGIPILLNLDNSITVTFENLPAVLAEQMNFATSDQQEKNFSLEDLCKAANSDLVASNNKVEKSRLSVSFSSSNISLQSKAVADSFVGLAVKENTSAESKQNPIILKDKQSDKYKCEYCGKICGKPSILQKHIRAHTNERPYPCEECGVQFKTKSNLYKHCKSRSHLIQMAQTATRKETGDKIFEKNLSPGKISFSNRCENIHENTSSSGDGQEDVHATPQGSVFLLNQLDNGQVILKPLSQVGLNSTAFNYTTASCVSPKMLSMECLQDSCSTTNCQRPFLKSFSEKGQPKMGHQLKPQSHSFSNDVAQIPKLDRTMTNDDIQKRISMLISLNDHIVDTPKEIRNHRFRKFVRDYSDGGNVSQDSFSGKLMTRSNSITPTLCSNDSFVSFCQGSKSPSIQNSNLLVAPTSDQLWTFVQSRSSSNNRPGLASQKIQHFSLSTTASQDVNEFRNFTKAHSFSNTQSILVSTSDPSLRALDITQDHNVLKLCSGTNLEFTSGDALENEHSQLLSKSTDANSSLTPTVSPPSSPIHSMNQRLKHKRGRPKGSKNKLKLSPVSLVSSSQPIVPSIHITTVEKNPAESHWRKELKRHLLMKRSMSNENSADHLAPVPINTTSQVTSNVEPDSSLTSCAGIRHLSLSSIPIKKRRKTLTELGRGTAFGTTVDDHNLDLSASGRAKTLAKPLWSSDGSFSKTIPQDDECSRDSKGIALSTSNKINSIISENIFLKETNSNLQISTCAIDLNKRFVNNSDHNSCTSISWAPNLQKFPSTDAVNSFVTFGDMLPQTSNSNLLPLNLLKERCVLIPTHYINHAAQVFGYKENNMSDGSQNESFLCLPSNTFDQKSSRSDVSEVIHMDKNIQEDCAEGTPDSHLPECSQQHDIELEEKHMSNVVHLKYKKCLHFRKTSDSKLSASCSTFTDHSSSNVLRDNSITEFSDESQAFLHTSLSSNISANDSLLRAQLDSEAAASLLDLSKSRHPSSVQSELSVEKFDSTDSQINSRSSNEISIPGDIHVASVSANDVITASPQNLRPPSVLVSLSSHSVNKAKHDDRAILSSVMKSYSFVEGKHICHICQKTFPKEHSLLLHKNVHYMEKPHRCGKCQATFQSNWLLKRHQNIAHHISKSLYDPRPFKCVECKVAFRTRGHLAKHARSKLHSQKLMLRSKSKKYDTDSNDDDEGNKESYGSTIGGSPRMRMLSFAPSSGHIINHNQDSSDVIVTQTTPQAIIHFHNHEERNNHLYKNVFPSGDGHCLNLLRRGNDVGDFEDRGASDASVEFQPDISTRLDEVNLKKLPSIGKARRFVVEDESDAEASTSDQNEQTKDLKNTITHHKNSLEHQEYHSPISYARTSLVRDYQMLHCRVCSATFKDMHSILHHYESHLEQRVHVCEMCDAGFKTHESLKAHIVLHSERHQHSQGIQTHEIQNHEGFKSVTDPAAKCFISKMVSSFADDSLKVLADHNPHVTCLPIFCRDGSFPNLSQTDVSRIAPGPRCIMSSGHQMIESSSLNMPSFSTQRNVAMPPHLEINKDVSINKLLPTTNEGLPIPSPSAHLFLQPISIKNDSAPLISQNTYLLVPPENNKCDTSPNLQEVFIYNPSTIFMTSGRSLLGSTSPIAKSSLTVPICSKPV